jgi:hypothetical protein
MQIFKVVDGELIINRPEILLYKNLGTILHRDKDRFKKQAFKELAYIYFTRDPESVVFKHGYNEQETHQYAVDNAKLDDSWEVDSIIKGAQKEYDIANSSVIKDVIREALIAFANYTKIIKLVRKHIDKILKTAEEIEGDLTVEEINKLISYSNQLIEIGNAIPAVKDKLYNSLRIVEKSMDIDDNTDFVRGSEEVVPESFMPENDK